MPSVAVVLSTYNGSAYVEELLDSLLHQTRLPDAIIISDDTSTDDTVAVVERYIASHQDFGVAFSFTVNASNRGWKANFASLLSSTSADYVFPCDQDDIWAREKIERMVSVMEADPSIDLLACSVEPIYERGGRRTKAETVQSSGAGGSVRRKDVDEQVLFVKRPGCTYCARGSFLDEVRPYWRTEWAHDAILWMLASMKGSLALLDDRLVDFRRHDGNASARKDITHDIRLEEVEDRIVRIDYMEEFGRTVGCLTEERQASLEDSRRWLEGRRAFLTSKDPHGLLAMFKGRSHYPTKMGFLVDVVIGLIPGVTL